MKNNALLTAVKQVFKDDPTFSVCYDVKTSYYNKAESEKPDANAAFVGDVRIGLRRFVAGAVLVASAAVLLRIGHAIKKGQK